VEFFLEGAKHAEIIRVGAKERTVATNDHSVYGADFHGKSIALLQVLENSLLVRMSDTESADAKFGNSSEKSRRSCTRNGR